MKLQETNGKDQLPIIYIVRALAFIGILFVHVSSVPIGQIADKGSSMFFLFNFLNIFNRFGTTTFIFLSAFVLFYRYFHQRLSQKSLLGFYRRRLLYILIPYLSFSLIYYVIQIYYSYGETWQQFFQYASFIDFVHKAALGEAFYHLYFVFINVQFYLLFPLLLLLLQCFPSLTKHLIWIGLVLQWGFIIYNNYSLHIEDKGQLAISYFSNYFLGAYFGIYYSSLTDWIVVTRKKLQASKTALWLLLWIVWIAASLADVYLWYMARKVGMSFHPLIYELVWNCQTITAALVLLQASSFLYRKLRPRILNILMHLGVVSFGMYFIHAGVLFYYYRIPLSHSPILYYSSIAGAYVFTLAASWTIVGLMQKYVGCAWILFGSSPKVSPYLVSASPKKCTRHTTISKTV
jgi:peptidoglycan/LPS O-acetylase OafA/YrhL